MQALVEAIRFDINIMYQMKIYYEVDYHFCINGVSFRSIKNWIPHILCVYLWIFDFACKAYTFTF